MLALAGMNVAGVAVFASIYAAAGARLLNQAAFLASLVVFSIAITALWVRVERSRGRLGESLSGGPRHGPPHPPPARKRPGTAGPLLDAAIRSRALSRLGRIAGALLLTLVAVPGLVLMPLFVLKEGLPAEARLDDAIRPAMVLLLVSLVLVTLTNVAGICFIAGAGVVARLRGHRAPPR